MDERLSIIYARRSVRDYSTEPIGQEDVRELLQAAMAAPSANNSKPWHFVVVEDAAKLKALSDAHPYAKMLKKAPLGIAVCACPRSPSQYDESRIHRGGW
jgi:nitroreductase